MHTPTPQTTATHSHHTPTVCQHPNTCVTTTHHHPTTSQSFHSYPSTTGLLSVIGGVLPQDPSPVSPLICDPVYPGHLSSIIKQFLLSWAKLRQEKLQFEANLDYRSIGGVNLHCLYCSIIFVLGILLRMPATVNKCL